MIISFLSTAGLFLMLEAYFLAVLQVLVYAGAVMVLFLFVIMLLDVAKSERVYPCPLSIIASLACFAALLFGVYVLFTSPETLKSIHNTPPEVGPMPNIEDPMSFATSARSYGYGLFTKYMLPFQVAGFLLLVAVVGIILISKRSLHVSGDQDNSDN
mgnify:FL=1